MTSVTHDYTFDDDVDDEDNDENESSDDCAAARMM